MLRAKGEAVKVIKPGRDQKGWAKELECTGDGNGGGGCGATLLVEEGDLFRTTNHVRDETTHFTTFKCIQCGVLTDLRGVSIPQHVRDRAAKRGSPDRSDDGAR